MMWATFKKYSMKYLKKYLKKYFMLDMGDDVSNFNEIFEQIS